jgi:hypothetical protein
MPSVSRNSLLPQGHGSLTLSWPSAPATVRLISTPCWRVRTEGFGTKEGDQIGHRLSGPLNDRLEISRLPSIPSMLILQGPNSLPRPHMAVGFRLL